MAGKKIRILEKAYYFETNFYEDGQIESEGIIRNEKKEKDWNELWAIQD